MSGKKKGRGRKRIKAYLGPPLALSIAEFCNLHDVSREQFFKMQREGWGPAVMAVGTRRMISHESAAAWRRQRERAAEANTATA